MPRAIYTLLTTNPVSPSLTTNPPCKPRVGGDEHAPKRVRAPYPLATKDDRAYSAARLVITAAATPS